MKELKMLVDATNAILAIEFNLLGYQVSFLNIILFFIVGFLLFFLLGGLLR